MENKTPQTAGWPNNSAHPSQHSSSARVIPRSQALSITSVDLDGTPNQILRLQDVKFIENEKQAAVATHSRNMQSQNQVHSKNMISINSERNERPQMRQKLNNGSITHRPPTSHHPSGIEQTNQKLDMYKKNQSSLKARFLKNESQTQQSAATATQVGSN